MKLNNKYYILRHGEALSNKEYLTSCWPEKKRFPLTLRGKRQIKKAAKTLKNKRIDFIFSSDLLRTRQTAEIVGKELGIKPEYDKKLREYNIGIFNGISIKKFRKFFPLDNLKLRFKIKPPKGETYVEVGERIYHFFKKINKKYKDKNILIISHEVPLVLLEAKIKDIPNKEVFKNFPKEKRIKTGELRVLK